MEAGQKEMCQRAVTEIETTSLYTPARRSDVSPIRNWIGSASRRSPSSELPEIVRAPVRFTELPPIAMLYGTYQSLEPRRSRPELAEVTSRS